MATESMTSTTTPHGRTTYRSTDSDRAAIRDCDGYLVFGRFEVDNGAERFVVAHWPRGRTYKTEAGARRAAQKWVTA